MSEKSNALLEQVNKTKDRCEWDVSERQRDYVNAYMYYTGDLPRPYDIGLPPKDGERASRAAFVENLVAEAERKLTPALLAIYTENDNQAVRFYGSGFKRDPEIDRLVNTEINQIFLHRNDGQFHLENAIKEALITGNGFMKVFVEEIHKKDKLPLPGWVSIEEVITQLSSNIDEDGSQWHLDIPKSLTTDKKGKSGSLEWRTRKEVMAQTPDGKSIEAPVIEIRGTATLTKVIKTIKTEQIDFKDLIFDTTCGSDFDKARYICHKRIITVGEALEMGFDATLLESAGLDNALDEAALSKRDLLPSGEFGSDYQDNDYSSDPMERKITLYESYLYSSIPTGKTAYYQVNHTTTEILDYKPVAGNPFVNGRVNIMPGSVWGTGLYDSLKHYQDIMSTFARVATQKAIAAAFPSYEAVKGQYDRESLLNRHRPGAVVEVMAPGVISLVPEPQMPPEFYSMMQFYKNSYEDKTSTSVGALSGDDGSMVENVSSQTVGMMIANEAQKDKIYGKAIARTLVRPLFEKIYKIMKSEGIKIYAQNGIVSADQLPEYWQFDIDINTANDKLMKAKQLSSAYQVIAQVAQAGSSVISPSNLVAAGAVMLDGSELDPSQYFTDPAANITPEMIAQQQKEAEDDRVLAHNAKLLAYNTADAQYRKTLAEIIAIEAKTDEHVKDGHTRREIDLNNSILEAQKLNINAGDKAASHAFNNRKADIDERFANQEVILKAAELHQKGSTNTDINGVNVQ